MNNEPEPGFPRSGAEAEQFLAELAFDDTVQVPPLPPATDEIERGMVTTSLK
ncbi:MAG: hypothetical protein HOQ36_18140, partial [Nocardia sp.]|nr:hypothetical protein [Nocardia sp.]